MKNKYLSAGISTISIGVMIIYVAVLASATTPVITLYSPAGTYGINGNPLIINWSIPTTINTIWFMYAGTNIKS